MKLKDIQKDEIYALVRYYDRETHGMVVRGGGNEAQMERAWQQTGGTVFPARIVEVGVPVSFLVKPGVSYQQLDRQTLQPTDDREYVMQPLRVLMTWDEWQQRYHGYLEEVEEREEERRRRVERERAEEHERRAREWMEEQFERANRDIGQVVEVLELDLYVTEDKARQLVELRNPDGNPYLNGTYTV